MPEIDVMIAIVGEQPMPVLIPIMMLKPDKVILLPSKDTLVQAERLSKALNGSISVNIYPKLLPPYDAAVIAEVCKEVMASCYDCRKSINITGGTKVAAVIASSCVKDYGFDMIYLVSNKKPYLIHWSTDNIFHESVRVKIPIPVRFACHGLSAHSNQIWDEKYISGARALAELTARSSNLRLINALPNLANRKYDNKITLSHPSRFEKIAAQKLHELGLWEVSTRCNNQLIVKFQDNDEIRKFLGGHWLEAHVYNECINFKPAFDYCWSNVIVKDELNSYSNELDVIVCRNEDMAICSCKTGSGFTKSEARQTIYELDSVAAPDKTGLHCQKILVTTRRMLPAAVVNRAKESKIIIITASDLLGVGQIISDAFDS